MVSGMTWRLKLVAAARCIKQEHWFTFLHDQESFWISSVSLCTPPPQTLPGQAGEQLGESQRGSPDPEVPVSGAARGAAGRPEGLRAGPDHRPAAMPALEPGGGLHAAG